jgi:hypothetical protein
MASQSTSARQTQAMTKLTIVCEPKEVAGRKRDDSLERFFVQGSTRIQTAMLRAAIPEAIIGNAMSADMARSSPLHAPI